MAKPTLGGTQFWTDEHFFHEWRIQRHSGTGECRLLDPNAWQHASGTFEECLAKLNEIRRDRELPPMEGRAVVLLHGLAAPRWSMHLLGEHLHKNGGYRIFNVEYASTRRTIDDHAASLARVLESMEGIEQIHLVGHSMGNVIIRRYLAGPQDESEQWQPDPRIRRIVMIAPPNHGALAAERLADLGLFQAVFGRPGQQLGPEWDNLEERLATPAVEFGIVAGGTGIGGGFNPLQPGDDDGRITVATTRLAGATDFIRVPAIHELIANDPRVFGYTLQFLDAGYFVSPEARQPIHE
ncbi:MAG: alpha/beta fold hydrolase [Patescibacteria group bacterium]|nr:alpha/beta fold hydrolase [Patescibacteria group bacterium]